MRDGNEVRIRCGRLFVRWRDHDGRITDDVQEFLGSRSDQDTVGTFHHEMKVIVETFERRMRTEGRTIIGRHADCRRYGIGSAPDVCQDASIGEVVDLVDSVVRTECHADAIASGPPDDTAIRQREDISIRENDAILRAQWIRHLLP